MALRHKNENPVPVPAPVSIRNWDDWFQNCDALAKLLPRYEELVRKYYVLQNSKTERGAASAREGFLSNHETGFYRDNPMVPFWKIRSILYLALFGFFVSTVLLTGIAFVRHGNETVSVFALLSSRAIWSVFVGMGIGALFAAVHILRVRGLYRKMGYLEEDMGERIGYLPPKYRNGVSAATFYELYTVYGIVTFQQAVVAVDEYLVSNQSEGLYLASMCDVPYQQAGGPEGRGTAHGRGLYSGDSGTALDPNLPEDIRSKTFSGAERGEEQLSELVGLAQVKEQIRQMKNRMDFYGNGQADRISGNHMVFLGPPGTGKTTIARILTKILYDFGYVRENKCVEIDGGYLKSPYVGQTASRAEAIIQYAMGGVLFIDEAYLMMDEKGGAGSEATGILLKAMEDRKHDFVVILAGYEDNVNRLLSSNEGFASRIKHKIYFENFTVEELLQIFDRQLGQYSTGGTYRLEGKARKILEAHFGKELRIPGFGNARIVRNTLDALLDIHADRFMNGELGERDKFTITASDVERYVEKRGKQMQEDGRNFIASRNLDSSVISLQELKGKTKPGEADPDKALGRLTGLQVVKDEIAQMKAQFSFYGGKLESEGRHMVFLGPPGTGKTTVASIMTGYLYQMGIISENSYLDINGDFLRGMYLGHTGKRTEAVVQYSQGMVLFIDEAYLLCSNDGGSDSFGQEAVGVLLDAMEKYRKNFVVVFAGYDREMNAFLDMNSGLRSRISQEFHFVSYTPHELAQMLQRLAGEQKFRVEKDVWVPLQRFLRTKVMDPRFGNGRYVRSLFESMKKSHIANYGKGLYGADRKYVITLADVESILAGDAPEQ